jgi:hypothetical protein
MNLPDDFRPSKFHLSNSEINATGILCGGAVDSIARELLQLRAKVYFIDGDGFTHQADTFL